MSPDEEIARKSYKTAENIPKANTFIESKNKDDLIIYFKNGSQITCVQGEKFRGNRSNIKHWQYDWESVTEDMINGIEEKSK